jgi:HD superfamily phosphohydrolase
MSKRKVFNDPIYGLIYFPFDLVYQLIEHKYFQRLRRISQMGLSNYIFPGANHTRFHHALGAVHLMLEALETLKAKGADISHEEAEAACCAILLHDVGHGPFSHCLEHKIVANHHEDLSVKIMNALNETFDDQLSLAIKIFNNKYDRPFFHQLVSSQLDVDRLDYLTRDSFYTGVAEGVIGYDRIIKMLNIVDDKIVVEEKAVYSIEKYLHSRRIMYWQVYLHKTSVGVEQMLVRFIDLLRNNIHDPELHQIVPSNLRYFLNQNYANIDSRDGLDKFAQLDDIDVLYALKACMNSTHPSISFLSKSLINRTLFKTEVSNTPFTSDQIEEKRLNVEKQMRIDPKFVSDLIIYKSENIQMYDSERSAINLLLKDGSVVEFKEYMGSEFSGDVNTKYFLCYPSLNS